MRWSTVLLVPALCLALAAQAATLKRNETVYADLDRQGRPQTTTVVTWLKTDGQSPSLDYNRINEVVNVKGTAAPEISGHRLRFAGEDGHIFYRGQTDQPLPLSVDIRYELDGKSVAAADLAGKSGRLTITMDLENTTAAEQPLSYRPLGAESRQTVTETLYVPFVIMVSLDLPLRQYENLETPEGVQAVVGETFKIKWMAAPLPRTRIRLSADAENIDLPAFLITATPRMVPLPDEISRIRPQLEKVHEGLEKLGQYLGKLGDGADRVAAGNRQVYDHLSASTEQYEQVLRALDAQARLVSSARKINTGLLEKISLGEWLPVLDQMNNALEVENQLLGLLLEGGKFSDKVLDFMERHGEEKPPLDHFPANIDHLREKFDQTLTELEKEKLPQLEKLRDGSAKLADGVQRLRQEGAERMQRELVSKADPLVRKLAVLDRAEAMAAAYDRFTGVTPEGEDGPPSAVQFILKTPGSVVP